MHPDGTPVDPATYDYRRQVLDAMHFPKLVDRLIQNLRRCAGFKMQYFGCIEAQKRLAPHLHMALRGVIPRQMFQQVVAATYHQVWWPHVDEPVYTGTHLPVWDEAKGGYVDPDDGVLLQTWHQALDEIDDDPTATPMHVLRFGAQTDYQGLLGGTRDSEYRIGYLCKYLTKSIADTYGDDDDATRQRPGSRRTWTASTTRPAGCRAPNGARTGCGSASNPTAPNPAWCPGSVTTRPTSGRTPASAAAASRPRGTGPARPSTSTARTAAPSSSKSSPTPGSTSRTRTAVRQPRPPPTANPATCGSRSTPPRPRCPRTGRRFFRQSRNAAAGASSTRPPKPSPNSRRRSFGNRAAGNGGDAA